MNNYTEINFKDFLPRRNGFVFKYKKVDGQYIHTYAEGELIKKMGQKKADILNHTLFNFLPKKEAALKVHYYEQAWNGEIINYEGCINGVYYLATLNPNKEDGNVKEVFGTAIDITEEKENEKKIKEMEKLALAGELAAGIAHEIRNPLTSLKGFTQLLRANISNDTADRQEMAKYIDIMLDELERLNSIVEEFLFIGKPNRKLIMKEINLDKLLDDVILFMEPQCQIKGITIQTEFDGAFKTVCDPDMLKQVFINIIRNAIEATKEDTPIINIALTENDQRYIITIRDYGYGVSKDKQKRLFEPFFTTKVQGTGLGLMVCKRIVELHNGEISLTSKEGEGTDVTIILPKE
ncbi:ATP-binding protein [Evansella clarkii]|uniref:ATP-binding protein n=1 Tax=Evansella clarkii TaxID=79879 RepID=UPI000B44EEB1|nr:ATP-binding protein [Evansella clarkii]